MFRGLTRRQFCGTRTCQEVKPADACCCLGVLVSCQVLVFRSILAACCVVTVAVGVKRCMRKACAGQSVGMRRAMFEGAPSRTRSSSASSSPMHMLHMGI